MEVDDKSEGTKLIHTWNNWGQCSLCKCKLHGYGVAMGVSAIFPNATVEKLEGTVLTGPWCSVEAKPLVACWRTQRLVGFGWATQR